MKFSIRVALLGVLAALALTATAAFAQYVTAPALPKFPSEPVQVRRNWGAVTGTVDSTSFLLKRGTSDGTASGLRDTLKAIDVSTWFRFPAGSTKVAVGQLHVIFGTPGGASTSGDSLGVEWQTSYDGTNWTSVRTVEWFVQTAGATYAALPIWYDADGFVGGASSDIGQARYVRPLLLGDSAGKQLVTAAYVTFYQGAQ